MDAFEGMGDFFAPPAPAPAAAVDESVPAEVRQAWSALLNDRALFEQARPRLRKLVHRDGGVPSASRAAYWLSAASVRPCPCTEQEFARLSAEPVDEKTEKTISLDIRRTLRREAVFEEEGGAGHVQLQHLLRVHCHLDAELGYCQGMSFIAGVCMCVGLREYDAFRAFSALMRGPASGAPAPGGAVGPQDGLRAFFLAGFPQLMVSSHMLDRMLTRHCGRAAAHVNTHGVELSAVCTPWVLTAFASTFNLKCVVRVWDTLFLSLASPPSVGHGMAGVLVLIALAIVRQCNEFLVSCDFDSMMSFNRAAPERFLTEQAVSALVADLVDLYEATTREELDRHRARYEQNEQQEKEERAQQQPAEASQSKHSGGGVGGVGHGPRGLAGRMDWRCRSSSGAREVNVALNYNVILGRYALQVGGAEVKTRTMGRKDELLFEIDGVPAMVQVRRKGRLKTDCELRLYVDDVLVEARDEPQRPSDQLGFSARAAAAAATGAAAGAAARAAAGAAAGAASAVAVGAAAGAREVVNERRERRDAGGVGGGDQRRERPAAAQAPQPKQRPPAAAPMAAAAVAAPAFDFFGEAPAKSENSSTAHLLADFGF